MSQEFPTTKLEPQKDAPLVIEDKKEDVYNPEKSEIIPDLSEFFILLEAVGPYRRPDFFGKNQKKYWQESSKREWYLENSDDIYRDVKTNKTKIYDALKRIIVGKNELEYETELEFRKEIEDTFESNSVIEKLKIAIDYIFKKTNNRDESLTIKHGGALCEIGGPTLDPEGGSNTLGDIIYSSATKYANINPSSGEDTLVRERKYNSFSGEPGKNYQESFENISDQVVEECGKFDFVTAYNVFCESARSGTRYGIYLDDKSDRLEFFKKIGSILKINGLLIISNTINLDFPFNGKEIEDAGFIFAKTKDSEVIGFSQDSYVFQYVGKKEKSI